MEKKPELRVYAGPNGSGKSTFTEVIGAFGKYINADEIMRQLGCSALEAAQLAEKLREESVDSKIDFSFETVMSTDRNLKLLKRAKENGYFIKAFYVITKSPSINISRVVARTQKGGHDVPKEKVISRYYKALELIPELVELCDVIHIYDNSRSFVRIFKKKKTDRMIFENDIWTRDEIVSIIRFTH
jgi:predicted ABC-type ATPase